MRLLQKILSHGLLIGFFVAVFFLYLYRVDLFPQWFGGKAQTVATPSETRTAKPSTGQAAAPPSVATQPLPPPAVAGAAAVPPAAELPSVAEAPPAAELPPVTEAPPAAELPPVAAQPEFPPAPVARGPEPEAPVSWAAPAGGLPPADYRPMPGETSAPPAGAPATPVRPVVQPERGQVATAPRYRPELQRGSYPASQQWATQQALQPRHRPMAGAAQPTAQAAAPTQSSDYEHRLAAARTHFWQRDIGAAMQAYESLTTAYPDSAEAWGESGNVSFKLGHWPQAAEAYYRAVSLLIERGEAERARHLLRVLHGLDADKAGELERRMRKPGG